MALKGNQGTLHEEVSLFLDDPGHAGICDAFQRVDSGHGRIETRRAWICHDLDWLEARHDWPGLKAIGKVMATREKAGKTTIQTCLPAWPADRQQAGLSAERFLAVTRAHWAIENKPALGAGCDHERRPRLPARLASGQAVGRRETVKKTGRKTSP